MLCFLKWSVKWKHNLFFILFRGRLYCFRESERHTLNTCLVLSAAAAAAAAAMLWQKKRKKLISQTCNFFMSRRSLPDRLILFRCQTVQLLLNIFIFITFKLILQMFSLFFRNSTYDWDTHTWGIYFLNPFLVSDTFCKPIKLYHW